MVRASLSFLKFSVVYPNIRVRTAPLVSVTVRNRVRDSLSFSGCALKLTLLTVGLSIRNQNVNLRTLFNISMEDLIELM